jgi:hypothetical protein
VIVHELRGGEREPLEAVTRRLVKSQKAVKNQRVP